MGMGGHISQSSVEIKNPMMFSDSKSNQNITELLYTTNGKIQHTNSISAIKTINRTSKKSGMPGNVTGHGRMMSDRTGPKMV